MTVSNTGCSLVKYIEMCRFQALWDRLFGLPSSPAIQIGSSELNTLCWSLEESHNMLVLQAMEVVVTLWGCYYVCRFGDPPIENPTGMEHILDHHSQNWWFLPEQHPFPSLVLSIQFPTGVYIFFMWRFSLLSVCFGKEQFPTSNGVFLHNF